MEESKDYLQYRCKWSIIIALILMITTIFGCTTSPNNIKEKTNNNEIDTDITPSVTTMPTLTPTSSPQPPEPILRRDVYNINDSKFSPVVFGNSSVKREQILTITFMNTLENVPSYAWDVSEREDGSVKAWVEKNKANSNYFDLYLAGNGIIIAPTDSSYLFAQYTNLISIDWSTGFDTSNVTSMLCMFYECTKLMQLDVSGFDTSNVTNMRKLFASCNRLTTLDVSNFDTSKVTNMDYMFNGCCKITQLDVSSFNTTNVTNMNGMFEGCSYVTELDVSNFNTSKVTNMNAMFGDCQRVEQLDVSGFDTSKVTDMGGMFSVCASITKLDLSRFNTANVTNMFRMFSSCWKLTELDTSAFDTTNVKNMNFMFSNCNKLKTKPDIAVPSGVNMDDVFRGSLWE